MIVPAMIKGKSPTSNKDIRTLVRMLRKPDRDSSDMVGSNWVGEGEKGNNALQEVGTCLLYKVEQRAEFYTSNVILISMFLITQV